MVFHSAAKVGHQLDDALNIVHRGSHTNGAPMHLAAADWVHDFNDDAIVQSISMDSAKKQPFTVFGLEQLRLNPNPTQPSAVLVASFAEGGLRTNG